MSRKDDLQYCLTAEETFLQLYVATLFPYVHGDIVVLILKHAILNV